MAKISFSSQSIRDLEHISDFLSEMGPEVQLEALDLIDEAINILARHPFIGRPAEAGLRELVISHGKTGYVALYSHEPMQDTVLILAIRHQRESGFPVMTS
jgi:plasmid stabilization system protein ParE